MMLTGWRLIALMIFRLLCDRIHSVWSNLRPHKTHPVAISPATFRKEMAKQDLLDMKAKQLEEKEKDVKKLQRKLQRQPLITS